MFLWLDLSPLLPKEEHRTRGIPNKPRDSGREHSRQTADWKQFFSLQKPDWIGSDASIRILVGARWGETRCIQTSWYRDKNISP